jgi:periplasmic protein TonB
MRRPAALYSLTIHALGIAFLFLLAVQPGFVPVLKLTPQVIPLTAPRTNFKSDAGGGGRALLRASHGEPPPRPVRKIWIPPTMVIPDNPKLVILQAALDAPDIQTQPLVIGDPNSTLFGNSPGLGPKSGIGDRDGDRGIGPNSGNKPGTGGPPGANGPRQRLSRHPELIYKEEPEYSEEARKVRFQGTVKLLIDVDTSGRATNIRVTQSVGLGLDERAIAAVQRWRFRPALSGDKPIVAPAVVEVGFHLL